jgi:hypothetical protein
MQINLEPRQDWFYTLEEKANSDELLYEITYSLANENEIVFVELIGQGSTKMLRINFNTTKGRKIGDFRATSRFSDVYFQVEKIRLYCNIKITFELSVYITE